jgi:small-conductance mechanosensitive channel
MVARFSTATLQAAAVTAFVEVALLTLVCAALVFLLSVISRRAVATQNGVIGALAPLAAVRARRLVIVVSALVGLAIVLYDGWLAAQGIDAWTDTTSLLRSIAADNGRAVWRVLSQIALLAIALVVVTQLVRVMLRGAEHLVDRVDNHDDRQMLSSTFAGLDRAVLNIGWLVGALLVCQMLRVPPAIFDRLSVGVRLYVVLAVGVAVVRSTGVVVGLLDRLIERYVRRRDWGRYYDHFHTLLPTFRACLEYALWVAIVSLALYQVTWLQRVAAWGPLVIQGLAIFFVGQLVIELGYMEIGHRMLPREGLEESERRRRATMVPLVRSTFMYVAYFMTAVLILSTLGFNPMPFLAGAGILGLVVGFGAQSLINDVVSGFFILIENIYLVGDIVEAGSARGVVEAIEFRTTKIRDGDGRLHIVRNGDMKLVVNYSKDYAVAVVALEVGYDADLRAVFGCLRQVGRQIRDESDAVIAETNIEGITAFGPTSMTIRTSTRVKPGYHDAVAAAMRLLIRDAFEMEGGESLRKSLIPDRWTPAAHATFSYVGPEQAPPRTRGPRGE